MKTSHRKRPPQVERLQAVFLADGCSFHDNVGQPGLAAGMNVSNSRENGNWSTPHEECKAFRMIEIRTVAENEKNPCSRHENRV